MTAFRKVVVPVLGALEVGAITVCVTLFLLPSCKGRPVDTNAAMLALLFAMYACLARHSLVAGRGR